MTNWIDVHTHLDQLEHSPDEAVRLAKAAGVQRMITIGTAKEDHALVQELAKQFPKTVFCTLGIHPQAVVPLQRESFPQVLDQMRTDAKKNSAVVAIGEIGLDFYRPGADFDQKLQEELFANQLSIAAELGLPVEIHTRDAEARTFEILQNFRGQVRGILHCFTGTQWLADKALDLGFDISFSGIVTFKNAQELREVCQRVPLNRMHVETDAPYLAPVPHRGKKNTPSFLPATAQFVADLKGVPAAEFAARMKQNANTLFSRLVAG